MENGTTILFGLPGVAVQRVERIQDEQGVALRLVHVVTIASSAAGSQVASRGGRRLKLRYLGTARNNAWLNDRTAALNLRNLIGRGLTRADGAWVLG
jgi:hypothetical protein